MNSRRMILPVLSILLCEFAACLVPYPASSGVLRQPASQVIVQEVPSTRPGETVSSSEVEKYVAVYDAMHRNHKLTLQEAAAAQGLSLAEFRDLEQKVEQNEAARSQAKAELMKRAEQQSAPSQAPSRMH